MTHRNIALFAAFGSFALLMGAFGFQYIGDLPPCKMCIWQRWPHGAAIALGLLILILPRKPLYVLGFAAAATTAAIGFYHAGVELKWWEGPNTCTSQPIGGLSSTELMEQIMNAPLVRCDEVAWSMLGISMAAWNGIISLGLAALWLLALRAK